MSSVEVLRERERAVLIFRSTDSEHLKLLLEELRSLSVSHPKSCFPLHHAAFPHLSLSFSSPIVQHLVLFALCSQNRSAAGQDRQLVTGSTTLGLRACELWLGRRRKKNLRFTSPSFQVLEFGVFSSDDMIIIKITADLCKLFTDYKTAH